MVELTEAQLYNLYSGSGRGRDNIDEINFLIKRHMAAHLYLEHKLGLREIAKRTGLKMKEVKLAVVEL